MKRILSCILTLCLVLSLCVAAAAEEKYVTWSGYVLQVLCADSVSGLIETNEKLAKCLPDSTLKELERPVVVRFSCVGGTGEARDSVPTTALRAIAPTEFVLKNGSDEYPAIKLQFYKITFDSATSKFGDAEEQPRFALVFDIPEDVAIDDLRLSVATEKESERVIVRLSDVPRVDDEYVDDIGSNCVTTLKEEEAE